MQCQIQDTTIPLGSSTYVMLDTFTALLGIPLAVHEIARYTFITNNTQTGTLRLSRSETGVAGTYKIFENVAVAIPTAPVVDSGPLDFAIQGIKYLKVEWINGGTNQTTWNPVQELIERQRAAQT